MTTKPPVALAIPVPDDARARIDAVAECVEIVPDGSGHWLETIAHVEALLCSNLVSMGAPEFDALRHLRVLSGYGVGFDRFDVEEASRRGITVCNTPGVLSNAVADLTIGLILAAARHIPEHVEFVRSGGWRPGNRPPGLGFDLDGKVLGLVGFGRIGQAVARRARVFGMRVCFFDLFDDVSEEFGDCQFRTFDDLLRESDIVSVHVDLNANTRHLIGERELSLMKPTAWLVNTARGPVVDQAALARALSDGRIAGAALDVLEREPPDPDAPILTLPNAIILPHVGSATVETRRAMLDLSVDNLIAGLQGQRPPACVNPLAIQRDD